MEIVQLVPIWLWYVLGVVMIVTVVLSLVKKLFKVAVILGIMGVLVAGTGRQAILEQSYEKVIGSYAKKLEGTGDTMKMVGSTLKVVTGGKSIVLDKNTKITRTKKGYLVEAGGQKVLVTDKILQGGIDKYLEMVIQGHKSN